MLHTILLKALAVFERFESISGVLILGFFAGSLYWDCIYRLDSIHNSLYSYPLMELLEEF